MSYKDKDKEREASKGRMRRYRSKGVTGETGKGVTKKGVTREGVTAEGTYFKNGIEVMPPFGALPERPRYLKLSDEQVLDRTKQFFNPSNCPHVKPVATIKPVDKRQKLEAICQTLKEHRLLGEVRYGVGGPTMDVIAEMLDKGEVYQPPARLKPGHSDTGEYIIIGGGRYRKPT